MVAMPFNCRFLHVSLPAFGIPPLNQSRFTANQEFQANEEAHKSCSTGRSRPCLPLSISLTGRLETLISEARPRILRRLQQKGAEGADLEDLCEETLERFLQALQRREEREQGFWSIPRATL